MNDILRDAYRRHGLLIGDNLKARKLLYDEMDSNPVSAQVERDWSMRDIFRFIEMHAWTHDPRPHILNAYELTRPTLPFLLYPYQRDFVKSILDHIQQGKDVLCEKSRDEGVSWLVITIFLWLWLQPVAGNDFLLGSRKQEYVDKKGAQDTLFEKFRYNLYRINPVFLPKGFQENKNDNVLFISNPVTGSYVRGESNNANFGTSGRYKAALMDEFSKWEETDDQAWTSMGDSSPCRIPVSTPWGLGRKFAQLRFSGAIDVLTLHWSTHPIKSAGLYLDVDGKKRSPWYDYECERRKDDPTVNVGQELDIDYLSSGSPYFDNVLIQSKYAHLTSNPPVFKRYSFERIKDTIKLLDYENGNISILSMPDTRKIWKDYQFCIGCDVAEGLEIGDFSVFYVYDRVTGKDVAWYHGKCDTDVLALLLDHFSKLYKNAYIAVESNNHGHAVIQKLKEINNYLMHDQDFNQYVNLDRVKLGWSTNVQTRPIMCADLREAINQDVSGIQDAEVYREAMTFIHNKNGKPEAESGNYDDRVMAQAIKFQCHKWLPAPSRHPKRDLPDPGWDDHGALKRTREPKFEIPDDPRAV